MREISSGLHSFGSMIKILLIIALSVLGGCDSSPSFSPGKKQHEVASPTLSPDNKSILFTLGDIPGNSDIAFYEIATKILTRINPTRQDCLAPIYSSDGKMLTFASGKEKDEEFNIFVMDADGSNLRQLTHSYNDKTVQSNGNPIVRINGVPSFTPDGKRIIFLRSGVKRQRSMGGTMISHWDFYEVEVATGKGTEIDQFQVLHGDEAILPS